MKIEIKLHDPKFCDGCPCIGWNDIGSELYCEVEGGMDCPNGSVYFPEEREFHIIRPKECVEKYGE